MFTIADCELLATLIIEVDELETAINDINTLIEISLKKNVTDDADEKNYFISLMHKKSAYINAKKSYEKKLKELEQKAYKDNYNPYIH